MRYIKKCPICHGELEYDDNDYMFPGCADEWYTCKHCNKGFYFNIRYHRLQYYNVTDIAGGEIETVYWHSKKMP